jgi:hypothetical protein
VAVGVTVAVAVSVGAAVVVVVALGVAVGIAVTVSVGVAVGLDVAVGVLVAVEVEVGVACGVPVGVLVGVVVSVAVGVVVGVAVAVGVGVAVAVQVAVGVGVLVGVEVAVGVGAIAHSNVPSSQVDGISLLHSSNSFVVIAPPSMKSRSVAQSSSETQWMVRIPTKYSPVFEPGPEKVIHSSPEVSESHVATGKSIVLGTQFVTSAHIESYASFIWPP